MKNNSDKFSQIGDQIKEARKLKKLTQKDLAQMCDISASYLQQLELGQKNNPSMEVLEKIALVLKVYVSYLFGENEEQQNIRENNNCELHFIINEKLIEDNNLSWKSKGILLYLIFLSKTGKEITVNDVISKGKSGRDSVYNAFKELRDNNCITCELVHGEKGRIVQYEYVVNDKFL